MVLTQGAKYTDSTLGLCEKRSLRKPLPINNLWKPRFRRGAVRQIDLAACPPPSHPPHASGRIWGGGVSVHELSIAKMAP